MTIHFSFHYYAIPGRFLSSESSPGRVSLRLFQLDFLPLDLRSVPHFHFSFLTSPHHLSSLSLSVSRSYPFISLLGKRIPIQISAQDHPALQRRPPCRKCSYLAVHIRHFLSALIHILSFSHIYFIPLIGFHWRYLRPDDYDLTQLKPDQCERVSPSYILLPPYVLSLLT